MLRLRDLVSRTGLNKSTVFRLLHNLERGGLIERTVMGQYRTTIKPIQRRKVRVGYACESLHSGFSREITEGLLQAMDEEGVDILVLDNQRSRAVSVKNVEKLIKARVDLAIEYQQYEQIATIISTKFREAGIPFIAISYPHPGAVYYGANNYEAGLIGGRALGLWAKHNFQGRIDEIILLGRPLAGPLLQSRLKGIEMGIREVLPSAQHARVVHLNGEGEFSRSLDTVRKHLRLNLAERTLVGAVNDPSALAALCAFHEMGRTANCGVVSQGASAEGRAELRNLATRLVGSVGYFPERYGRDVLALTLKILDKKRVPSVVFAHHSLITPENVDHFYPHDSLAVSGAGALSLSNY